jgi:flagellar biosynthetic protein FliQ
VSIVEVTEVCRGAIMMALMISAPVLTVAVLVGLAISIAQAVTQIQDQTVSIIPKIVVVMLTMLYVMPWSLGQLVEYSTRLFTSIPTNGFQ